MGEGVSYCAVGGFPGAGIWRCPHWGRELGDEAEDVADSRVGVEGTVRFFILVGDEVDFLRVVEAHQGLGQRGFRLGPGEAQDGLAFLGGDQVAEGGVLQQFIEGALFLCGGGGHEADERAHDEATGFRAEGAFVFVAVGVVLDGEAVLQNFERVQQGCGLIELGRGLRDEFLVAQRPSCACLHRRARGSGGRRVGGVPYRGPNCHWCFASRQPGLGFPQVLGLWWVFAFPTFCEGHKLLSGRRGSAGRAPATFILF